MSVSIFLFRVIVRSYRSTLPTSQPLAFYRPDRIGWSGAARRVAARESQPALATGSWRRRGRQVPLSLDGSAPLDLSGGGTHGSVVPGAATDSAPGAGDAAALDLGNIVIHTGLKPSDDIVFRAFGCNHDDRLARF